MKFSIWPFNLLHKLSFKKKITISLAAMSLMMILYMAVSSYSLSSGVILDMSKKLAENNFKNRI